MNSIKLYLQLGIPLRESYFHFLTTFHQLYFLFFNIKYNIKLIQIKITLIDSVVFINEFSFPLNIVIGNNVVYIWNTSALFTAPIINCLIEPLFKFIEINNIEYVKITKTKDDKYANEPTL